MLYVLAQLAVRQLKELDLSSDVSLRHDRETSISTNQGSRLEAYTVHRLVLKDISPKLEHLIDSQVLQLNVSK